MKNILNNILSKWALFRQSARKGWHAFLFTPARYWQRALLVFAVILIIILLADGWLFWRFGYAPQYVLEKQDTLRTLNHKELEAALTLLRERGLASLQKMATTSSREIFDLPPTPAPVQ